MSGAVSFHGGLAAEDIGARDYEQRGMPIVDRRWRRQGGEIDLIACRGEGFVFIEVKKSRHHRGAAERLSPAQMQRIYAGASEYLAETPLGQNTDARFDVALVDQSGRLQIIENAFGH